MKIIGVTGSLRKDSYNTWLLNAVAEMTPEGVTFQLQKIDQLCLYNEDLDNDNKPEPVVFFTNNISSADALLFATPEYNYAIPGSLKNAIDWAASVFATTATRKFVMAMGGMENLIPPLAMENTCIIAIFWSTKITA